MLCLKLRQTSYVVDDISAAEKWLVRERASRVATILVEHVNAQLTRLTKSHVSFSRIYQVIYAYQLLKAVCLEYYRRRCSNLNCAW